MAPSGEGENDIWLYKYTDVDDAEDKEAPEDHAGDVIDSPLREADLISALDDIEATIGATLDADPNNQLDESGAAGEFESMRDFISKRIKNIRRQLR